MRFECLPIQPKPLRFAQALSRTGAESVKSRAETSPTESSINPNNCLSRSLTTL